MDVCSSGRDVFAIHDLPDDQKYIGVSDVFSSSGWARDLVWVSRFLSLPWQGRWVAGHPSGALMSAMVQA